MRAMIGMVLVVLQTGSWRPEDRVLLTDFSRVTAVAASPFMVFAATTGGLIMYDRGARSWRPPVTTVDGYPEAPVRVALADVTGNAVWLGTRDGWARYDADIRMWQAGPVPGGVLDLLIDSQDPASGIFVRSGVGWDFLPRGGAIPGPGRPLPPPDRRVRPLDPTTALSLAPVADAMRALILTDPRLRTYQFTSAARTPDQSDFFFGTTGLGVIRIDPGTGEWEPLPFGLVAPGAGALAAGVNGVWVAAMARVGERRGLSWVSEDLSRVGVVEAPGTLGLQFAQFAEGRRMLARQRALWVATERGVLRYVPDSNAFTMIDRGLPVTDVLSLAPAPDGVWAGTTRGLAVIGEDGTVTRIAADFIQPVLALLAVRESLWVGTPAGLGLLPPGGSTIVVPQDVAGQPALRSNGGVIAIANLGDRLIAATPDQLAWRSRTGAWTILRPAADLGRLTSLTADAGGVWVGGTLGLAYWNISRSTFRTLRVPIDLPGPVRDVARADVDDTYLWVATDHGVVRFRRNAVIDR